jgi:ABC-type maltose transport system permease subunit
MVFLGKENLAMASVIAVYVWRMTPLAAVILMAGLTAIPRDLLDQANVDGAGFWRILWEIELPLILPIMSIALLFGMIFTVGDMAGRSITPKSCPSGLISRASTADPWAKGRPSRCSCSLFCWRS